MNTNALNQSAYNSLASIDEASKRFSEDSTDLLNKLECVLKTTLKYNLEHCIGLRLLHRHHGISENELMLETYSVEGNVITLTTAATSKISMREKKIPNSWKFHEGRFVELEYSVSELLSESDISPATESEFFSELGEVLSASGLEELVGPCLLSSKFVRSFKPGKNYGLLEETDAKERKDVKRYTNMSDIASTSIETTWCLQDTNKKGLVIAPVLGCTTWCPKITKDDGTVVHQGTTQHDKK